MASATIQITQGAVVGGSGESVIGFDPTTTITLTDDGGGGALSYLWEVLQFPAPDASAPAITNSTSQVATITPSGSLTDGVYIIRLIRNDPVDGVSIQVRFFAVGDEDGLSLPSAGMNRNMTNVGGSTEAQEAGWFGSVAGGTNVFMDAFLRLRKAREGQSKVSSNDTTFGLLEDKIVSGPGVQVQTLNDGSNESIEVSLTNPTQGLAPNHDYYAGQPLDVTGPTGHYGDSGFGGESPPRLVGCRDVILGLDPTGGPNNYGAVIALRGVGNWDYTYNPLVFELEALASGPVDLVRLDDEDTSFSDRINFLVYCGSSNTLKFCYLQTTDWTVTVQLSVSAATGGTRLVHCGAPTTSGGGTYANEFAFLGSGFITKVTTDGYALGNQSALSTVGATWLDGVYDGSNLWVIDPSTSSIAKVDMSGSTPVLVTSQALTTANARSIIYDGSNLWVGHESSAAGYILTKIVPSTLEETRYVYDCDSSYGSVVFDGRNIWMDCSRSSSRYALVIDPQNGRIIRYVFTGVSATAPGRLSVVGDSTVVLATDTEVKLLTSFAGVGAFNGLLLPQGPVKSGVQDFTVTDGATHHMDTEMVHSQMVILKGDVTTTTTLVIDGGDTLFSTKRGSALVHRDSSSTGIITFTDPNWATSGEILAPGETAFIFRYLDPADGVTQKLVFKITADTTTEGYYLPLFDIHDQTFLSVNLTSSFLVVGTVTLTTTGGAVLLMSQAIYGNPSSSGTGEFQIKRDSTIIAFQTWNNNTTGNWRNTSIVWLDEPPAGTYTYTVEARETSGDQQAYGERQFTALELKLPDIALTLLYSYSQLGTGDAAISVTDTVNWTEIRSTTLATIGDPVMVLISGQANNSASGEMEYRITREGTEIFLGKVNSSSVSTRSLDMIFIDESAPEGSNTYVFECRNVSGPWSVENTRQIAAIELHHGQVVGSSQLGWGDPATTGTTNVLTLSGTFPSGLCTVIGVGTGNASGSFSYGNWNLEDTGSVATYRSNMGVNTLSEKLSSFVTATVDGFTSGSTTVRYYQESFSGLQVVGDRALFVISWGQYYRNDSFHQHTPREIDSLLYKPNPSLNDLLLIEDSGSGYIKTQIKIGDLPIGAGSDSTAIHDNVAGEITAVTEKVTPVSADVLLIEDSADSSNKKRIQIGNLPSSGLTPPSNPGDDGKVALAASGDLSFVGGSSQDDELYWDTTSGWGVRGETITISPIQITANQNDYSPTGFSSSDVVRLDTDASRTITGFDASASRTRKTITNVGSNDLVLTNEDASSSAVNRVLTLDGSSLTLVASESCGLYYDPTSTRWRVIYAPGAGGSGTDANAIHDNVAGEIAVITEKTTPVSADILLIEDSADSNNKKRVLVGNLPGGGGGLTAPANPGDDGKLAIASGGDLTYVLGTSTEVVTDATTITATLGAEQRRIIEVDTSHANWDDLDTVTLPASPVSGGTYIICDGSDNAGTKGIRISPNGKTISGRSGNIDITIDGGSITLFYTGTQYLLIG